jgi:hypothetical protein
MSCHRAKREHRRAPLKEQTPRTGSPPEVWSGSGGSPLMVRHKRVANRATRAIVGRSTDSFGCPARPTRRRPRLAPSFTAFAAGNVAADTVVRMALPLSPPWLAPSGPVRNRAAEVINSFCPAIAPTRCVEQTFPLQASIIMSARVWRRPGVVR